jgi:hypothetical protein
MFRQDLPVPCNRVFGLAALRERLTAEIVYVLTAHPWSGLLKWPSSQLVVSVRYRRLLRGFACIKIGVRRTPQVTLDPGTGLECKLNHDRFERLARERNLRGSTDLRCKCSTPSRDAEPISRDLVHCQFRLRG